MFDLLISVVLLGMTVGVFLGIIIGFQSGMKAATRNPHT